jgi:hypothetical protein
MAVAEAPPRFVHGQLVWAKFARVPWWPAEVRVLMPFFSNFSIEKSEMRLACRNPKLRIEISLVIISDIYYGDCVMNLCYCIYVAMIG